MFRWGRTQPVTAAVYAVVEAVVGEVERRERGARARCARSTSRRGPTHRKETSQHESGSWTLPIAVGGVIAAVACGGTSNPRRRTVTVYVSTDRVFSEPVLRE
jgi:hypothetical protein